MQCVFSSANVNDTFLEPLCILICTKTMFTKLKNKRTETKNVGAESPIMPYVKASPYAAPVRA